MASRSQSSGKLSSKNSSNAVNRDRIHVERIRKELQQMTFFTGYTINPFRPGNVITGKPNSWQEFENFNAEEDGALVDALNRGRHQVPKDKYSVPQTSSHEIGWLTKPLIEPLDGVEVRLNHPRRITDATRFQEEMCHFMKPTRKSSAAAVQFARDD